MALVIVTGMSGAGKSVAMNALEDMGYYCVDNLPARFLVSFADIYGMTDNNQEKNIATIVDVRSKDNFSDYFEAMKELSQRRYPYRLLYLDADNQTLLNRYKFTRRRHPLMENEPISMETAIQEEREFLKSTRLRADYEVDTSAMKPEQLRERIVNLLSAEPASDTMLIRTMSFGFREGVPSDVDLVFDVRCLPNPYYVPELRMHTGMEACIQEYVMEFEESKTLFAKILDMVRFLVPLYRKEGKRELVVAFGCTGGRHRSVCFAERFAESIREDGIPVLIAHRELCNESCSRKPERDEDVML